MILFECLIAFAATVCFAVLFYAPKKELPFCGFTGALGWLIYRLLVQNDVSKVMASMLATAILTIFARAFAVVRQNPVTVYLMTGIFSLVPGAGLYYTTYYLFIGNRYLFAIKGLETFEIAGAIVFGIIFGFALPQNLFHKLQRT